MEFLSPGIFIYIFEELLVLYVIPSKLVILQNSNGACGACFFLQIINSLLVFNACLTN